MKRIILVFFLVSLFITSWGQSNLTQAEYFFDTDPGMGSALPIAGFTTSTTIDVNDMIDVSGLSIGMHTLGIRVMDDNNVWSMAEYIPVFVTLTSANAVANLTAAEYFFDTDPGMGSGTAISLTTTQNIDVNDLFSTSALSLGMHTLNIRIRNEFGQWSMVESVPVFVTRASALVIEDIDAVEYFFDSDPSIGLATPLTITTAQNIDINDMIPTGALSIGMHTLNIRIRTTNGEWSMVESVPVFISQDNLITQLEHFVDADPGIGGATNVPITPPTNSLDEDIIVSTGALGFGPHTMNVRIGGATIWGQTESIPFNICSGANADFTSPNTCFGDATNFTDTSTGVIGGDNYFWDFENDGATDDVTNGDVSFIFSAPGSYKAELLIDRSGCEGYRYVTVEVVDLPTSVAGSDQTVCAGDPVNLAGIIGGSATTSLWSTSGTGNFDDNTSPTTFYTPDASDISAGSVVLTLSASEPSSVCSDALSQLTVTFNTAIQMINQTADASIGDLVNIDVFEGSTINSGDVLATTIIQQPTKGIATILADGTIDYVADENNVGIDVIVFEVCNQCGNCDTKNASINILNEPPVIDVPLTNVESGSIATIPLIGQLSDINDNIDLSTLEVVVQPTSGAFASISPSSELTVDYTGVVFSGRDELTLRVCDFLGACDDVVVFIEVGEPGSPNIIVYNAVSPNGDGKHDFLEVENIEYYPNNKVTLFNRWGDVIYESIAYDNTSVIFEGIGIGGKELTSGTYYYSIDLNDGSPIMTGFVTLSR